MTCKLLVVDFLGTKAEYEHEYVNKFNLDLTTWTLVIDSPAECIQFHIIANLNTKQFNNSKYLYPNLDTPGLL